MLVVADERPLRIGRERRLARARQAEEDRHVTALADVDRRVHRQHALIGQSEVHDAEGALLDLAGVLRAADEDLLTRVVDHDDRLGARPIAGRVGSERRGIDDGEIRLEDSQLGGAGASEEVAAEDARPGALRVGTHRAAVVRIRADEAVLDVDLALAEVVEHARAQRLVALLADGVVEAAPPDAVVASGFIDRELVLGRAAGVLAGPNDERSAVGDQPFVVPGGVFVQLRRGEVGERRARLRGRRRRRRRVAEGRGYGHRSPRVTRPAARGGREPRSRLPQSGSGSSVAPAHPTPVDKSRRCR